MKMSLKTRNWILRLSVALFLALVVGGALLAAPPATKPKKEPPPPFGCFTDVWAESFDVVKTHYDKDKHQLTWTLKAKKDVTMRAYHAQLGDWDNVELAIVGVKFNPNQVSVKKGAQIEATIDLSDVPVSEVGICNIREHR
jgi:hypothetical protein